MGFTMLLGKIPKLNHHQFGVISTEICPEQIQKNRLLPAPRRIMSAWADAPMLTCQNKQLIHGSPRTAHSAEFQMEGKQHGPSI